MRTDPSASIRAACELAHGRQDAGLGSGARRVCRALACIVTLGSMSACGGEGPAGPELDTVFPSLATPAPGGANPSVFNVSGSEATLRIWTVSNIRGNCPFVRSTSGVRWEDGLVVLLREERERCGGQRMPRAN